MTKQILLKLKGVIKVKCIVSSKFTRTYTGSAQIKSDTNKKDLFRRAVLDCIYQHLRQGGKSSPQVQIISYNMKYLGEDDLIKISRRKRKGKYYNYVIDKKSGKIITYSKWNYERNLNKYV